MTLAVEKPPVSRTYQDATDLAGFVWRNRRAAVIVVVAAAVGSAAVSMILPHRYRTVASFVADQGTSTALSPSLLGLAGSLGVSLGGGTTASPQFYAAVAQSDRILEAVVAYAGYPLRGGGTGRLADAFGIRHERPEVEEARTIKRLRRQSAVAAEPRTGIVQIAVTAPTAALASAIGQRYLSAIDSFNVHLRTSRGAAEESFVERRLSQAGDSLREAEQELARFQMANRVASTPELRLELGRLERAVELRQSVYVTLAQGYEQAKITARRDVPAITTIERAEPPLERAFPKRKIIVAGAVALSAVATVLALVALHMLRPVYPRNRWPRWLAANIKP
jgi:uncharacterized protein involved in exopolysaccharide biosynthesis